MERQQGDIRIWVEEYICTQLNPQLPMMGNKIMHIYLRVLGARMTAATMSRKSKRCTQKRMRMTDNDAMMMIKWISVLHATILFLDSHDINHNFIWSRLAFSLDPFEWPLRDHSIRTVRWREARVELKNERGAIHIEINRHFIFRWT